MDKAPSSSQLDSSLHFTKAVPRLLPARKEGRPQNHSTNSLTLQIVNGPDSFQLASLRKTRSVNVKF